MVMTVGAFSSSFSGVEPLHKKARSGAHLRESSQYVGGAACPLRYSLLLQSSFLQSKDDLWMTGAVL
jgi:hypothetical protein